MLLHLLFSTFLWMPSYYSKLWDNTDVAVVPVLNSTKLDKFGMMKTSTVPTGLQVVFDNTTHHYDTANSTVFSTWPVAGPMKASSGVGPLSPSHATELLTTVTNIITLRSKLNWIGESSTLLGIISGDPRGLYCLPATARAAACHAHNTLTKPSCCFLETNMAQICYAV